MEALIVLLFIVIIIVILNQNNKLFQQLQKIEKELKQIRNSFNDFSISPNTDETKPGFTEPVKPTGQKTPYESIFRVDEKEQLFVQPVSAEIIRKEEVLFTEGTEPLKIEETITENKTDAFPTQAITPIKKQTFFERHPDMEKFIGENLVNKIGIAILVLAIGFFVKYAIDQNWVGPVGRVAIGILCGSILIGIAHKMRNSYTSFSSVLAGGGLAVYYFTITLAYHQFQLFNQTTAFIIMVIITAFAVALSILYDKQELAVIALLGGFLAPFLVSNGSGNYQTLFIYLIVLNTGLLTIAYNKAWRLLNFLSFFFTIILFGSWLISLSLNEADTTYTNAFIFAGIFYLLFFAINVAHNIREKKKFIASDFGILLANTALYFCVGIYCLIKMNAGEFKGLFSAGMGVFNLVATYFLFRKQKVDTNILYLLMGITLTFISITAPLQLSGNNITMFWASEAVLLYWLFTKSNLRIIQYSSVIIWALMIISLLMDWMQVYTNYNSALKIIINKGYITTLFAAIATYVLYIIRTKEKTENTNVNLVPGKLFFRVSALLLLFAAGALEINHQFEYYYPYSNINLIYLLLYTFAYFLVLVTVSEKIKSVQIKQFYLIAMLIGCILFYLFSIGKTFNTQAGILTENKNHIHFLAHWFSSFLFLLIIHKLIKIFSSHIKVKNNNFIAWIICIVIIIFFSVEVHLITNSIFYSGKNDLYEIHRVYIKTGLPILWGLCSFAFMWLGMRYKYRPLRIISLSLFTLTLLKLFVFDIRNIPAGGKIAAFFCLGIILLIVSFMYQRLKKIIIDNEKKVD